MKKKLFKVTLSLIDAEGDESLNFESHNVIALTADRAMKKVRLVNNKNYSTRYQSVELIAQIDKD